MTPPLVTVRPDTTNDTGPRHVVVIAGMDGPSFVTPALAELYADQLDSAIERHLAAAMALDAAAGQRAAALRSQPDALDAIVGRTVSPRSALLRALRWILDGEGGEVLRSVPALGKAGEMAVIHDGEEGDQ